VGPFHHGTARPGVADGGDGFQMWRVAANMLIRQHADSLQGVVLQIGVGRGTNKSST
jgi:hypothetical protein